MATGTIKTTTPQMIDLGNITIPANSYNAVDSTISDDNKIVIPFISSYSAGQIPAISFNTIRSNNKWYIGYHNPTNVSVTISLKCQVIG